MRRKMLFALALVCALGMSASADTTLFTTQEDFTAGWSNNGQFAFAPGATSLDGSAVNGAGNTSNPGSAGTSGSLSVTWLSGSYNYSNGPGENGNSAFLSALGTSANGGLGYSAASGVIKLDYTKPPPGTGNYFQLGLLFNYDSNFGQYFGTEVDNLDGTFTASIPYTVNATSSTNYFQFALIYNSNYNTATPFTVDNIRVAAVPEPASMGLLSIGGIALIRRRRAL